MLWEASPEKDSRDQNDETETPAESTNGDEDRNTAEETETGVEQKEKAASETSTATSVFHNLNVFRDFFLAAFSDGYNVCNCCLEVNGLSPHV